MATPNKFKKEPYQHLVQLNFLTKYRELLKVVCEHGFFKGNEVPSMEILPSKLTATRLKQYGLVYRQEGASRFAIGYSLDPNDQAKVQHISEVLQLTFWMKIPDLYFLNYTDLPFEFGDSIYYFNNLEKDKLETEHLNLSINRHTSGDDRLPTMPNVFVYEFEDTQEDVEIQVVSELDEVVFEEELEGEAAKCTINLTDAAPGKYTLLVDGMEEKVFYLYPPTLKRMFGVVDIFIDKDDFSPYALMEDDKITKKRYTINFKNRATRWKYLFVENTPQPLHDEHEVYDTSRTKVRRKDKTEPMTFLMPETETMSDGLEATVVFSERKIPFVENQIEKFKLRTKKGRSKVEWLVDLPSATPKTVLKPDSTDENAFFSELIVYL